MMFKAVVVACSAMFGGCVHLEADGLAPSREVCEEQTYAIRDRFLEQLEEVGFEGRVNLSGYCAPVEAEVS